MEENFNSEEELNAEEPALSKEEILARSRKENERCGDEREQGRKLRAKYLGFVAVVLACGVVMMVRLLTEDVVPYDLMAIMLTGLVAQNTVELFVTTNKTLRAVSIVAEIVVLAAAIMYWVEWGLSLAGK